MTQNRAMSACLGVRASVVDATTFALGAGLAGLAGCALTQIGNVGPSLGQNYIVDSFMVVVTGGVVQSARSSTHHPLVRESTAVPLTIQARSQSSRRQDIGEQHCQVGRENTNQLAFWSRGIQERTEQVKDCSLLSSGQSQPHFRQRSKSRVIGSRENKSTAESFNAFTQIIRLKDQL